MRANTRFHRRSNPQGLVHPREVMVHVVQRDHGDVVFQLFRERISQAREAAHVHPHVEILAFDVASRDELMIRVADNVHALGSQTQRGL